MKHVWRFLLLAGILIVAAGFAGLLFLYTQRPRLNLQGSNSTLLTRYYRSVEARQANDHGITLTVDGKVPDCPEAGDLYMDEDLVLRMPASWVNDYFDCDLFVLPADSERTGGQDSSDSGSTDGQDTAGNVRIGGQDSSDPGSADGQDLPRAVRVSRQNREGSVTLPMDEAGMVSVPDLAAGLGFSYDWDPENYAASIEMPEREANVYPARFDLRDEGRVSPVRDQAQWANCWAFAALSAVESTLLPKIDLQLSPDHLTYHHGFSAETGTGGDYNMALAYFAAWRGPVTEEEDPYGDEESPDDLDAIVHVQDAVILRGLDIDRLKGLIAEHGAVESAIYARQNVEEMSDFYDEEYAAYYYTGDEACNHDIVIIGWDDAYPGENFPQAAPDDGAFLCKNSWGEYFGDNGYFYISYYDVNIGRYGVGYTGVESADNYDHIYQYDQLGWTGAIGYGKEDALLAAVFTADSDQLLQAASFYATDPDTWYDVYLVDDFAGPEDFAQAVYVRSGYLLDKGFFTVDLGQGYPLDAGERFAVAVRIRTKEATHPVAMEYAGNDLTSTADVSDGETYMSPDGIVWTSVEEAAQGNVCLKVYTRDK